MRRLLLFLVVSLIFSSTLRASTLAQDDFTRADVSPLNTNWHTPTALVSDSEVTVVNNEITVTVPAMGSNDVAIIQLIGVSSMVPTNHGRGWR